MRILIIEDNESVAKGIAYRLNDRGHATDIVNNGLDADSFVRSDQNELIIMDISLPGMDGVSILQNLRARGDQRPVLLLTAKSDLDSRVAGLDAGADDYLTKPFEMDELEARLRAMARRRTQDIQKAITFGPMRFDLETRQAWGNDAAIDLSRRELAVFEALITARGRVVSKNDLFEHVYGTGSDLEESAIEMHISRLRKRLKPFHVEIQMRRGLGYRLIEAQDT